MERTSKPSYPDNLNGWVAEAVDVMRTRGIPGSAAAIHVAIEHESGGDPDATNYDDLNARAKNNSRGLMQVVPTTFRAYHVPGTSWDITDPVANICAACAYAADTYGSIDNVVATRCGGKCWKGY
ncbi:transglycosylase SLT domain-containing protein [Kitasatospora xanthocidica]|uniref:transglycosylase SLT domain-containing protein n=1 Tax=Kitasatospora xanthocidica TaxID=83382 RepID=UPI00216AF3D3|nr:transglycosylase SLT domain-containing protein [Kitasatospora xanthocidica]